MALRNVKITEKVITEYLADESVDTLRDTENRLMQLRFMACRTRASWRLLHNNCWHKVAEWPEFKVSDIRKQFIDMITDIRAGKQIKANYDSFSQVCELLDWFVERQEQNRYLSMQRKRDICSVVKCHLLPLLGDVNIAALSKPVLDRKFIRPVQQVLAKTSVTKAFHTLKSAFVDAVDLDLIPENPLVSIKISDFGDFSADETDVALKPRMLPDMLAKLAEQPLLFRVLVMVMLVTGTRITETLNTRWPHMSLSDDAIWDIPAKLTKTGKPHSIAMPDLLVGLLIAWKIYLRNQYNYVGPWLFPNKRFDGPLSYKNAYDLMVEFSEGEWSCHALRGCARQCWVDQGVDYMVGERMLNHKIDKTAEAYIDKAKVLRLKALNNHCEWLKNINAYCFLLSPSSAQNDASYLIKANKYKG